MAIEVDWLGGNCPVQAEGRIDGEPFYFRARYDGWELLIGSDEACSHEFSVHGRDVIGAPRWCYEEKWGSGPFDAGWMPENVARSMIGKGADLWRAAQSKGGDP